MRPIHVVVLLLAGALGGAVIMKLTHPGQPLIPVADAVEVQPVIATISEQPTPAEAEPEAALPVVTSAVKPSPMPLLVKPPAPAEAGPVAAPPIAAEEPKPSPMPLLVKPSAAREVPRPQPARPAAAKVNAPVLAVVLHPPTPQPQIAESPPALPAPTPILTPPPASPEPEQVTPIAPPASAAPVPQPHQATLNAGLILPVRLLDGLSSERNAPGDAFAATLDKEVVADGFVIAERGARVEGRVVAVDRAKVRSSAALALELTTLHTSDGQTVEIRTDGYFKHAEPPQVNNTSKIAGGAIIGAGVGGGAGVGDVLLTRRPVELPSESLVTFRLKTPVPLTEHLH